MNSTGANIILGLPLLWWQKTVTCNTTSPKTSPNMFRLRSCKSAVILEAQGDKIISRFAIFGFSSLFVWGFFSFPCILFSFAFNHQKMKHQVHIISNHYRKNVTFAAHLIITVPLAPRRSAAQCTVRAALVVLLGFHLLFLPVLTLFLSASPP